MKKIQPEPQKMPVSNLRRITSYLTEESYKKLQKRAIDADKHDYEILQEAVDQYLGGLTVLE